MLRGRMKLDRVKLCQDICKLVGIARYDEGKDFLTKRELRAVHGCLSSMALKIKEEEYDNASSD